MRRVGSVLLLAALIAGCSGTPGRTQAPTAEAPLASEEPVVPDGSASGPEPTIGMSLPTSYAKLDKRGWQKIVKAPDRYIGKGYRVVACIYQFDAATGEDSFMAYASWKLQTSWFLKGDNAAFTGNAKLLADFVGGDIVSMSVVALGSYSYDTQAGGNTTVPSFQVIKIRREKGSCE